MLPTDLELLAVPGTPALHDDLLLVGVSRPDPANDRYRGGLRRIDLGGGGDRAWTHGPADTAPAISPDGRWVAFLRATEETGAAGKPQLHVMPADGGESRRVTELPLGAGAPVWAPDSRRIAFVARDPEPGRYGTPSGDGEPVEPGAEPPRRITRLDYRVDDLGFLADRPQRLYVLDAVAEDPQAPVALTDRAVDVSDPAWTPDGEHVLVVAPRDWGAVETLHSDVYAVPAGGGEPVLAVLTSGNAARPAVGDGVVWFVGREFTGVDFIRNDGLFAADLRLDGEPARPRRLTDAETVYCASAVGAPVAAGDEVLVGVLHRGATQLRAVPRDAEAATLEDTRLVVGERSSVRGFAVHGGRIVVTLSTPVDAGEVVLLDGGRQVTLTGFSAPLREAGVREPRELTATAPDGYPVHGWVVLPEGPGPHPTLLVVHGGPFAAYEWGLFDEAQVYAAAGYAVLLANPRGSAGYGESHGRAIIGRFGTVDADDLLAFLDAGLALPETDSERVGVMGGSYGGWMTTWLAAHHGHRFRAAWSERAVNAWDSFVGSSDIGWEFVEGYVGTDVEKQRENSPLSYADRIGIPFAVVHSEHDWRCPVEQAQRLYVALRKGGVDTEMLLFPGEGHELSRSGRPRHRVQRFDAVLDWWSRRLKS
ncbi:S9 family peptidase [Amycolatopsis suaedae]|uniref:S9 family peptidase n=1 Tax=Amycolatopsis suaedae TaxID=2510978 RepID=A0A4Q7J757_9PSEU|nr:S9 family peptidase [Amycolatopsis suaedae]RZQ62997.1 S9 family peptidase [Amycolatopsis suaedae]